MTKRERTTMSPVGAVVRGVAAGALGTAAMDLLLYSRYRRGGGDQPFVEWELSAGLSEWDGAPAPALVGKRVVEGVFGVELSPRWARLTNNVTHWAYGIMWGGQYGIWAGSARAPHAWYGLIVGTVAWGTGYVVLPLAKLYRPIWEYDAKTLARDYSGHLVFGATTGVAFRALSASHDRVSGRHHEAH